MGREVLASIRTQYPSFTRVEKSIADYVLDHGGEVVNMRIRELAFRCSVGESSIVRFCRTIGLGGYDDLRLSLAAALEREPLPADETEAAAGNIADELCRLHCQSLQNARSILKAETLRAVSEKMLAARQIYFFAPAGAHALAAQLSDTVLQTIGKGVSLTPPYPKALCRREMNAQDLAFLLSTDTAPDNADVRPLNSRNGAWSWFPYPAAAKRLPSNIVRRSCSAAPLSSSAAPCRIGWPFAT